MEQENFTGNERQLKLLLKAIRENNIPTWNNFVKSSGKYFVANLSGINLSYHDLKEINFNGANLTGANLEGTDLTRAQLDRSKLMKANLSGANLTKAIITNSYLQDAILTQCNAFGANFKDSDLTNVNLDGATLEEANIFNTNMKNTSLNKTNMKGTKKSKGVKIIPKPKKRELTTEDKKKLSPWKLAKQEETMRRVIREKQESESRQKTLQENLRAKDRLNRNIFTSEVEPE
ncbi:MAG: pentapeptide repeat-containing protein [Spirochaetales bacterium]|nr:pentapeptide repeat-containing protein [Spirochaetales bacterium]